MSTDREQDALLLYGMTEANGWSDVERGVAAAALRRAAWMWETYGGWPTQPPPEQRTV